MQHRHRVRGITLIGFLIVLVVVGFFAYATMRLFPVYTEYFGVMKAMNLVAHEPGSAQKSTDDIRRNMILQFNTQYVDEGSVPPQAINVIRQSGNSILRVAYEKRVPFMYNVDLLVTFDKSMPLTGLGDN
ncbi:MAG: DUF4845 domain-containing protein [Dokdonella sp.]